MCVCCSLGLQQCAVHCCLRTIDEFLNPYFILYSICFWIFCLFFSPKMGMIECSPCQVPFVRVPRVVISSVPHVSVSSYLDLTCHDFVPFLVSYTPVCPSCSPLANRTSLANTKTNKKNLFLQPECGNPACRSKVYVSAVKCRQINLAVAARH